MTRTAWRCDYGQVVRLSARSQRTETRAFSNAAPLPRRFEHDIRAPATIACALLQRKMRLPPVQNPVADMRTGQLPFAAKNTPAMHAKSHWGQADGAAPRATGQRYRSYLFYLQKNSPIVTSPRFAKSNFPSGNIVANSCAPIDLIFSVSVS